MKRILMLSMMFIFLFILSSCKDELNTEAIVIDEIVIGEQTWTAYNYDSTLFQSNKNYGVAYQNDDGNLTTYGALLTYQEALDACPDGWHLPTLTEWQTLFTYLGGTKVAGGKLKSTNYWQAPNLGELNSSGFRALPGGGASNNLQFDGLGWSAHFWSATKSGDMIYVPTLFNDSAEVELIVIPQNMYASVRYIKDK